MNNFNNNDTTKKQKKTKTKKKYSRNLSGRATIASTAQTKRELLNAVAAQRALRILQYYFQYYYFLFLKTQHEAQDKNVIKFFFWKICSFRQVIDQLLLLLLLYFRRAHRPLTTVSV